MQLRLIGYCTEVSLFLVYEFIENGNLSEHLRGLGREPLPWLTRIQIALDSARGLEYIHEHTNPVYIHRDIKSSNILIDKNFRAKVADFGLAKLPGVGVALQSKLVGTFGYMPPEKLKRHSILHTIGKMQFEEALGKPDPKEELEKLVDPRLNQDYPLYSILCSRGEELMALLAKCCTQENPHQRPSMRQIVVSLMTLSSATEDWNMGSFFCKFI
ncbi:hypothetical protein ZIOFF_027173 [Zingiber officinale]|uniref:Protein kinase domain-containing protein n=1 Tax=Zingiber officinale TaxID=94328 RepID=A0A8J5GYF0_ZINOF|nr:hypothetical protein ZIOFF_027173 [Zingiber officinale]